MSKILAVDDSESIRIRLSECIKESGYEMIEAFDGLDGYEKFKENYENIKMIITDLNMPKMNGIKMIETIKESFPDLKIPILVLTTETSSELKNEGKKHGVLGWIVKPLNKDNLIKAIHLMLEKKI